jgi:uncharacterized protein YegL
MSQLLNTIIVLLAILIIWFILRFLFRKLVEPNKVFIHGPGQKSTSNVLGFLSTEKKSTGYDSLLVDEKKVNDKEVAEVFISEDQNSVEFNNILLIDNSGSTADQIIEYKKALKSFVSTRFQNEKNAIYTFSDTLKKCCDFTGSQDSLFNAIDSIQPEGATAMNDALIAVADLIASQQLLKKEDNKNVFYNIILFTDGLDNVSQNNKEAVKQKLEGKSIFIACTKETDLPLMYELAKNPKNVFIIGNSTANNNTLLSNGASASLEEALLKIRNEKMKGRGSVAYVQMKDENNQFKIRGFVNVLGEIYSCGSNGEGAFFIGLCESPGADESKVFLGNYVDASRTNEDFNTSAIGNFGNSKSSLPVNPVSIAGGAWAIYLMNKKEETKSRPENILNAFPKVALFSLLIWSPVYLIYWLLKYTADLNIFGWLGKEFDITITQIILFFVIWSVMSSLYVDLLRRKKGFMLFNDAINNIVGTKFLSTLIIILCVIGIVFSVLVFYPFSYTAFFVCTLIAYSANLILSHGGGKNWFINTVDPEFIRPFYENENGRKVILEFEYETVKGKVDTIKLEIKSNGNSNQFNSINEAVNDTLSKNIIDYLENCVHITAIYKNYDPLSEILILVALGSLPSKPLSDTSKVFLGTSEILLKNDVALVDKLIFTLSLLKESAQEVIYSDDFQRFALRTPNSKEDSPFIFDFETKNHYHFSYSENKNAFELSKPNDETVINWVKI